ncbi:MAG: phosphatidate cytidylyltransferase [Oscillospiraceae bacterium]|nr:phosphatidate cytidylyltransferase [Oscillospiraceae bacterium]
MKVRILAAVVLLPLLLAVVLFLPKLCTAILFGAMCAIAAKELLSGTGLVKQPRLVTYGMIMAFFVAVWSSMWTVYTLVLLGMFCLFVMLAVELLMNHRQMKFEELALTFVAGYILPFLLSAVVRIHNWTNGRVLILLPFVISFMSDTGAYFTGCFLGKRKLAPEISPNKTVEGLIGGLVGAVVGVVLYCLVMEKFLHFAVNYYYIPIYGILGSLAAVLGDLCFSVVKRQTGIKDYGNLIPGHGGILDRFDSMIVVAPLVELLMLFIPMVVK